MQFSRSGEGATRGDSAGWSLKAQQHARAARAARSPSPVDLLGAPALNGHDGLPSQELPRKEVIQPHLPVRLPCYDFTPLTSPTFDGSLPLRG